MLASGSWDSGAGLVSLGENAFVYLVTHFYTHSDIHSHTQTITHLYAHAHMSEQAQFDSVLTGRTERWLKSENLLMLNPIAVQLLNALLFILSLQADRNVYPTKILAHKWS